MTAKRIRNVIIAGGSEAAINESGVGGFNAAYAEGFTAGRYISETDLFHLS